MPNTKTGYHDPEHKSTTKSPPYIIEGILPSGCCHILCGRSGVGKTPLLISLLDWLRSGKEVVLGKKAVYTPHVYVSFEEPLPIVRDRLTNTARELDKFLCFGSSELRELSSDQRLEWLLEKTGDAKLIAIESLDVLFAGSPVARDQVRDFMSWLQIQCSEKGITIIGSMPSPPSKAFLEMIQPREKIFGSISWSTGAQTVMTLEDREDKYRELTVCPRSQESEIFLLEFDALGGVEVSENVTASEKSKTTRSYGKLDSWLKHFQGGKVFTRRQVQSTIDGVSQATFSRWVRDRKGQIVVLGAGRYKKLRPS